MVGRVIRAPGKISQLAVTVEKMTVWRDDMHRQEWLANCAVNALLEEAELTPKPGLVDRAGRGAHTDMNIDIMRISAHALYDTFREMASAASHREPSQHLREELARIGRRGEKEMLQATGGVNTHKGAIWALGLLTASAAMLPPGVSAERIAKTAGQIASYEDRWAPASETNGSRVRQRYGVAGAREEARQGFPHVVQIALPALWKAREGGVPETAARLDALVHLIANLDDTCILHRGGLEALFAAKKAADAVIQAGGVHAAEGRHFLRRLHEEFLARHVSPGGSADLLAAALFLDRIRTETSEGVLANGNIEFSL